MMAWGSYVKFQGCNGAECGLFEWIPAGLERLHGIFMEVNSIQVQFVNMIQHISALSSLSV